MKRNWAQEFHLSSLEDMYDLPRGLLSAVIQQESAGRPDATGPETKSGTAKGISQFVDKTAKAYGVEDPYNPNQAIPGMARMLGDLNKQYKGDINKVLAGYNWGSGNMAKFGMENMPAETRNYIGKVRGYMSPGEKQYASNDQTASDASTYDDSAIAAEMRKRGLMEHDDGAAIEAEMKRRGLKTDPGRSFYDKVSTGIYGGVTKRGIGLIQAADALTGKNMLSDNARAAAQRATANIDKDMEGTGVPGFAGEMAGDPVNWMMNPGKNLVTAGAKIGALSSGTAASEQDKGALDRAVDASVGGGVGAAGGYVIPKVAGKVKDAVTGVVDRALAGAGSVNAQQRIVYRLFAEKALKDGFTPEEITVAIQRAKKFGMDPTLGEATGSRGLMRYEKKLATGAGEAATNFNDKLAERGNETIPGAVSGEADKLIGAPGAVDDAYASAAQEGNDNMVHMLAPDPNLVAPPGGAKFTPDMLLRLSQTFDNMYGGIDKRLQELGAVNNVESQSLRQVKTILDNAKKRGGSFDAILDAKKQLDNLYIDGADASIQRQANRYVTQYTKDLDGVLGDLAPVNYPAAKTAAKNRMAGRSLEDIARDTVEGGNTQMLARLTDPGFRGEFLAKLPDDPTRAHYQDFFDTLDRIRRGHGGRERLPGMGSELQKDVIGADPGWGNPLGWGGRAIRAVGEAFTPGVYKEGAEAAWNPNVEKLTDAMTKKMESTPLGRQAGMVAAGQAAQSETQPPEGEKHSAIVNSFMNLLGMGGQSGSMTTPEKSPAAQGPMKLTITPQDKNPMPAVNLPVVGPQSSAVPTQGDLPPIAKLYARFLNNDFSQGFG